MVSSLQPFNPVDLSFISISLLCRLLFPSRFIPMAIFRDHEIGYLSTKKRQVVILAFASCN